MPRPGRLGVDKEDPDAVLILLSVPYPLAPFLSLSKPRNARTLTAVEIRRRRR